MIPGERTVDRYLKVTSAMYVTVEMTLKYGCIKRFEKCGCRRKILSVTFSETGADQIVWVMWLYVIIWGVLW